MRNVYTIAFAAVLVSSSAISQVSSMESANPAPKSVSGQELNKVVCEVDSTTGTRLGNHKVCHTVSEWAQLKQGHRDDVERAQQQLTGVPISK